MRVGPGGQPYSLGLGLESARSSWPAAGGEGGGKGGGEGDEGGEGGGEGCSEGCAEGGGAASAIEAVARVAATSCSARRCSTEGIGVT